MRVGRTVLGACIAGAAVSVAALATVAAGAAGAAPTGIGGGSCTGYPYASTNGTDPNGFQAPNETSYVAACLDSAGYDIAKKEKGPAATITWGQPGTWTASARQAGFPVGSVPAAGLVIEIADGQTAAVTGLDATPDTVLSGPVLGVVVDASGGLATFRVYDLDAHRIDEFRQTVAGTGSPTYLDLASGHRATAVSSTAPVAPATSASAKASVTASAKASASATPSASASPTVSPSLSSVSPQELGITPGASSPSPSTTDSPSVVASSSSDSSRHQRYIVGAVTAVLLVIVLSMLGRTAVSRRRRH